MQLDSSAQNHDLTSHNPKYYALIYFLSFVVLGVSMATLGPMVNQLAKSLDTTVAIISIMIPIKSIGYFVGTMGGGVLIDRFKAHKVVFFCILGIILTMFSVPLAPSIIILGIIMILMGIFEGIVDIGGNTMLMWVFHKKLGPVMNALHLCFGVGAFLSPIIIANFIVLENSLQWTYWILALLFLPSLIGFALLPSPKPHKKTEIPKTRSTNTLIMVLLASSFFAYVGAELTFGNWIFTYAFKSNLTTEVQATYLTSIFWGAFALGRLLSIPASRKLSPELVLSINMLGSVISVAMMVLIPNSALALMIASIALGLFMASTFPTLLIFAEKRFNITGSLTSWFIGSAGAAGIIIPFIMTNLFTNYGIHMVPLTIFAVMSLAVIILFVMLAIARRAAKSSEILS